MIITRRINSTIAISRIIGLFDFRVPFFVIRDPEVIKQLAVKDFDHFVDHRSFIDDNVDTLFGNTLSALSGEKWRDMRATLSPAFTGSKMRKMFTLVSACAIDMAEHFKEQAVSVSEIHCNLKDIFSKFTNDVIATSAFGIHVNSFRDTDNDFLKAGSSISNANTPLVMLKFVLMLFMPSVMKALNIELFDKSIGNFFRSMVLGNIRTREENGIFRPDMINLLMEVKQGVNKNIDEDDSHSDIGYATVEESNVGKAMVKRQWNDDEIVAQCLLFYAAGFDTASTVLSFIGYELAINPDVQQKLYEEIIGMNRELNGKPLSYDSVQKLQYMDMVISETLRMWPPAGLTDRVCVKDYVYENGGTKFVIEKGQYFWIPIFGLHHDPKYFPSPEKFDPERFNNENKDNIVSGTYMPFGVGPRNCIGKTLRALFIKNIHLQRALINILHSIY